MFIRLFIKNSTILTLFRVNVLGCQPFTKSEIADLSDYFQKNITLKRCPNKTEVDAFLTARPIRENAQWQTIKFWAKNPFVKK
jgi:hypothetical protein